MGLAWGAFSAASAAALAATGRFMFPNVLAEPPQQFKVGLPERVRQGVNERCKAEWGFWIVRIADENVEHGSVIYALSTVCTHLGCPPNWLLGGAEVQVPLPRQRLLHLRHQLRRPGPPAARARQGRASADDGQIVVDKSQKFQQELGQWADPEAFIKA